MSRVANGVISRMAGLAVLAMTCGAPLQAQQPAAAYTHATRYNVSGQVTGTIAPDPDGAGPLLYKATRNTYGTSGATNGLLLSVESGELSVWQSEAVAPSAWSGFAPYLTQTFAYDSHGRKIKESVVGTDGQTESVVQYSYDDWSRVRCKAVRMNKAAFGSLPSDACVLGAEGEYGPDRITRFTYNNFDQVLTEERAVGTALAQTYVTNQYEFETRLLRYQTDARGNMTELQYDGHQRLKKRLYPSPSSVGSVNSSDFNEYGYDNNGNVTWERKRNTQSITNEFDNNNRLVFKDLSDNTYSGDIAYDYDLRGLALRSCFGTSKWDDDCDVAGGGDGEVNSFDGFGALTSRTSRMAGVDRVLAYAYDAEGNRTRITHPGGIHFTYGRDGLSRMCAVGEGFDVPGCTDLNAMLRITYRPSGGRLDLIRPSGAVTNLDPDNALRLKKFTQDFAGSGHDLTNEFEYNPASQITKLTQSNSFYTYAELGSRVGNYTPNGLNQIANIAGHALSYDGAGNLTNDAGTGMTYTYDMENRLVATGGTASTLVYDVLGRLAQIAVGGTTTQFHYDGDALVGEYVGGVMQRRYVHGDQIDEPLVQYNLSNVGPGYRRYLHADHQGSIIAHSDNPGALLAHNKYDPYGVPGVGNADRFGYTGQTWIAPLGLNYYKARMYSPKLGRFLQTDPIFYADDMNMYAYTRHDPVNGIDPNGTDTYTATVNGTFVVALGLNIEIGVYFNSGTTPGEKFDFGFFVNPKAGAGLDISAGVEAGVLRGGAENLNGSSVTYTGGAGPASGSLTVTAPEFGPNFESVESVSGNSAAISASPLPVSSTVTMGYGQKFGFQDVVGIVDSVGEAVDNFVENVTNLDEILNSRSH